MKKKDQEAQIRRDMGYITSGIFYCASISMILLAGRTGNWVFFAIGSMIAALFWSFDIYPIK